MTSVSRFFKPELTVSVLLDEYFKYREWCEGHPKRGNTIRFGQLICDKHLLPNATAPEIFYESDTAVAFSKLFAQLGNGRQ